MQKPFFLSCLILLSYTGFSQSNTFPSTGKAGVGTTTPTHSLTLAQGTTWAHYNTADTTNYERVVGNWSSNIYTIGTSAGGTGTVRSLQFGVNGNRQFTINVGATVPAGNFDFTVPTGATGNIATFNSVSLSASSGTQNMVSIQPTVNQTGTAGFSALQIAPYISTSGSGNYYLINAGTNTAAAGAGTHTNKFTVDATGGAYLAKSLSINETSPSNVVDIRLTPISSQWLSTISVDTPASNGLGAGLRLGWGSKTNGPSIRVIHGGDYNNAGIGFSSWAATVETERMRILPNGNIGIGTVTPQYQVDVNGAIAGGNSNLDPGQSSPVSLIPLQNSGKLLVGWNRTGGGGETDFISNMAGGNIGGFNFYQYSNAGTLSNLLSISGTTGNVWIGSPNALSNFADNYKLNVNGFVRANKVVVNSNGADFVFEPAYKLMPLTQLEEFVKNKQHLPGIETAANMQKDGLDVGTNQTKLLQKVEELTLYIIDQNKTIKQQQVLLEKLQAEVDGMKKHRK